ncbi:hypothetical protein CDD80_6773 [Ophiocordyceps camponoti-rufipedis]|uniref:Cyclin-like domain-containing protein n=1 Tax=Ophiocordyceps camponoti-rufipedis TaxID=2004952 RepID=A0A2C5YQV0_9HYPO|nr:hypothetical protein CDD80_6773 [Ophiocordyceps camponoti-rufipedis]
MPLSAKRAGGPQPRFARPNPVRAMREREERRRSEQQQQQQRQQQQHRGPQQRAGGSVAQCPNKACPKPNVVDGTCQTCGRVADESNIVAEVQFGETSSGAAMVQGSFVGADQAGVRSMGPAFRRVGGSDDRDKSIREARGLMQGYAQQLNIGDGLVTAGTQVFKLASSANFVQGRTLASVAAVCLYAACRAAPPCKLMLIDLADLVQLNVFKLGRIFKRLNEVVPIGNDGLIPVYPEDLIWRFATKMEFHQDTAKVAEDAVRLVKRMSRDWMVMGRRPSGICGACLLMAARMHNFRRTVREVVYIVKVTNHTIQNRLQEFNFTASSNMSVEDFLKQDFLESSHDPPSFYRKSEEFRNRKRAAATGDDAAAETETTDQDGIENQQQRLSERQPLTDSGADLSKAPAVEFRRDADGFIIPPLPSQIRQQQQDGGGDSNKTSSGQETAGDGDDNLERLVSEFGDELDDNDDDGGRSRRNRAKPSLPINEEWEQDELELEGQIEEIFNDPLTYEHALAYSNAEQRARIHTTWALQQRPPKEVSMATTIDEDEFADDPEVANCLLSPDEARIKELIWVNQNKDWLRKHQEKVFRRKVEADRPKQTRRRRKRARMGEGQTSPASSAAEAAISVAKDRAWSKRINYDAIRSMFDAPNAGLGSAKTSVAGSVLGLEPDEETGDEEPDEDEAAEAEAGGGGLDDEEYDNPDLDAEYGLDDEP